MRPIRGAALLALLSWIAVPPAARPAPESCGRVLDGARGTPVPGAIVTAGNRVVETDGRGAFAIDARGGTLRVRAHGYARREPLPAPAPGTELEVRLRPFRPKALYLTVYGIGSRSLRDAALALADTTEINALVIDLKGDRGIVPYRSAIPIATAIGAQRVITIPDLPALVAQLHQRDLYAIARIVVFKDDPLAQARPDLAVRRRDGSMFRDREGLAWSSADQREVWNYNIGIALEAAKAGFDEIQFDYIRLPDTTVTAPRTEAERTAPIDGFLAEARRQLTPFNVFLAADVFGYVCWNTNDTGIGQRLEHLADAVDYLSPMLYPSSFQYGIPGYRHPVEHPYQIVRLSLEQARDRTALPPVRFRPWLQAFGDYAFGGRPFTAGEVRRQIQAAEDFGANGWMLWNARNRYSAADLRAVSIVQNPAAAGNTLSTTRRVARPRP